MSHHILAIPALNDNYIWTIVHVVKKHMVIIDPGEAAPIFTLIEQQNFILSGILITHHHWDHINGIQTIIEKYPVPIYGPAINQLPFCDHPLTEDTLLRLPQMDLTFKVLEIPGHTINHIAFWGHQWVFTGDTLFTGGCGRIFEGSPEQLYHSLTKLASLDPKTRIYCGHEYTTKNLQFAAMVEPDNLKLKQRIIQTNQQLNQNQSPPPSTIKLERQTNPFLRCHEKSVRKRVEEYCGHTLSNNIDVFTALRRWKDKF